MTEFNRQPREAGCKKTPSYRKGSAIYRRLRHIRYIQTASDRSARVRLFLPKKRLSAVQWNKDYETRVSKRDLIRLLNDCLENRQFQSHVILTLYLYSDIAFHDMTQIRWRDVYNFKTKTFRSRITSVNAPLSREAIQALLLYLAQYPESQPMDFILTSHGKPMTSSAVYQRIRNAVGQLTEMRLGELRAWARRTLADRPSPPSPERPVVQRHTHNIGIAALKARYANRR